MASICARVVSICSVFIFDQRAKAHAGAGFPSISEGWASGSCQGKQGTTPQQVLPGTPEPLMKLAFGVLAFFPQSRETHPPVGFCSSSSFSSLVASSFSKVP